jgi:aldehyde:ferredoxin oxidoreductase
MAWTRQILRVDLTKGICKAEPLNMAWALDYLGQRGLATKYFIEEVDLRPIHYLRKTSSSLRLAL